jgi:hypothetical protein
LRHTAAGKEAEVFAAMVERWRNGWEGDLGGALRRRLDVGDVSV